MNIFYCLSGKNNVCRLKPTNDLLRAVCYGIRKEQLVVSSVYCNSNRKQQLATECRVLM